jgi:hypothetical protein
MVTFGVIEVDKIMLTRNLEMLGYFINHKNIYKLMFLRMILENPRKLIVRNFLNYGCVAPKEPLHMI